LLRTNFKILEGKKNKKKIARLEKKGRDSTPDQVVVSSKAPKLTLTHSWRLFSYTYYTIHLDLKRRYFFGKL